MLYFLARLEETPFSIWIRETGWVFFSSLTLHSLSLALVVGVCLVILWRELGFATGIRASRLNGFRVPGKFGLTVVLFSGVLLLLAYPAKALTNPVFYLKLGSIIAALAVTRSILDYNVSTDPEPGQAGAHKKLAAVGLLLWLTSVTAGRFLAYTHNILLASSFY